MTADLSLFFKKEANLFKTSLIGYLICNRQCLSVYISYMYLPVADSVKKTKPALTNIQSGLEKASNLSIVLLAFDFFFSEIYDCTILH